MMKGKLLWLRNLILNRLINFLPAGPSEKELQKGNTFIYAQVENDRGQKATVTIQGPEAYVFTAQTLTNISQEIIQDNWKAGFQTPSIFNANVLYNNYNNVIID